MRGFLSEVQTMLNKMLNKFLFMFGLMTKQYVYENYIARKVHNILLDGETEQKEFLCHKVEDYQKECNKLIKTNRDLQFDNQSLSDAIYSLKKTNKHLSKNVDRLLRKQKEYKATIENNKRQYKFVKDELLKYRTKAIKLESTVKLLVSYNDGLNYLIDTYRYGYSPSYLECLKPRTVVELSVKELKKR